MSSKPKTTKQLGWDDESIKGGNFSERPEVFKARQGFTDVVRIITLPESFIICSVNPKSGGDGKGFSSNCLADHEDVLEGIINGNDREARKRAEQACPMLERGYSAKRRFVTLIWHEARINSKGQTKKINQVMPFIFDGGKYEHIRTIASTLPPMKDGKRRPLHLVELQITCTDNTFQKMNFSYAPTPMGKWPEIKEKIGESFEDGVWSTDSKKSELIQALLECDTRQRLIQSIDRVEGKGTFEAEDGAEWEEDGEEMDEAPKKTGKKTGKKTAKKAPAKAEKKPGKKKPVDDEDDDSIAEELDEALDDSDLEEYEEEIEED